MAQVTIDISPRSVAVLLAVAILCSGGIASVSAFMGAQNTSNGLPVALPYQGTLGEKIGQTNNAVSGTRDMQFRLFDANTGGTLLYESPSRAVEVERGKFSVVLGTGGFVGTPGNELAASDLRTPALWLELTMNDPRGGAPITFDRQRLAPAPQAIIATASAGDFSVPGGLSVGGTAQVSGTLNVNGDVTLGDDVNDTTTVTGLLDAAHRVTTPELVASDVTTANFTVNGGTAFNGPVSFGGDVSGVTADQDPNGCINVFSPTCITSLGQNIGGFTACPDDMFMTRWEIVGNGFGCSGQQFRIMHRCCRIRVQ